ncbi:hypothetical protein R1flu_020294 [Riccia fluitans]|uniref:Uncharacterized protein n=1 Tax=Riccia fluitans TaxID=41844 RepID=A0ABD1ZMS8_9MARC
MDQTSADPLASMSLPAHVTGPVLVRLLTSGVVWRMGKVRKLTERCSVFLQPISSRAFALVKFITLGGQRGFDGATIEFLQSGMSLGGVGDLLGLTCRDVEIQDQTFFVIPESTCKNSTVEAFNIDTQELEGRAVSAHNGLARSATLQMRYNLSLLVPCTNSEIGQVAIPAVARVMVGVEIGPACAGRSIYQAVAGLTYGCC